MNGSFLLVSFQEMVVTTLNAPKLVLLRTYFGSSFHQGKVHKRQYLDASIIWKQIYDPLVSHHSPSTNRVVVDHIVGLGI
jgi:hypothetical protein